MVRRMVRTGTRSQAVVRATSGTIEAKVTTFARVISWRKLRMQMKKLNEEMGTGSMPEKKTANASEEFDTCEDCGARLRVSAMMPCDECGTHLCALCLTECDECGGMYCVECVQDGMHECWLF